MTVILRLVIDRRGRLVQGAVVDVNARTQARFTTWRSLTPAVRAWLANSDRGTV